MKIPVREKAYIKIYEDLRQRLETGKLPYGGRLPSKRQLAEDFNVSVITAEHALALLCDEGYIEARQRSGFFSIYKSGELFSGGDGGQKRQFPAEPAEPDVDFRQNEKFPVGLYARTVRRVLTEYGAELMEKCPGKGTEKLRGAISSYLYSNRGIKAGPSQIVIGSGAEYLYGVLVQLLGREKTYGIEYPSYEKIRSVYGASGVKIVDLALGTDGIEKEALFSGDFDILHISPYRSYPTGVRAGASKRREYLSWARQRAGRIIIEDDFESEFNPSAKPAETLYSWGGGSVIYLNTFSKTVAPSVRTGYMVLPEGLLNLYEERTGFYSCTVPVLEQYVLADLIENGDFARHINKVRRMRRRG